MEGSSPICSAFHENVTRVQGGRDGKCGPFFFESVLHFLAKHKATYRGRRLPYRSSMHGTCSLLAEGIPDEDSGIPLLKPENALRTAVAVATVHPHVCGRVIAVDTEMG